ncbi:reductive dehalogenase [candidate division KSB1 bacterium]
MTVIYHTIGIAAVLFFLLFLTASIKEKKTRAAIVSFALLTIFPVLWWALYYFFRVNPYFMYTIISITTLLVVLFFLPAGRAKVEVYPEIRERVDERDTMFAREEYTAGTEKHKTYYTMRPEKLEIDEKIRVLPELLKPGGRYYDRLRSGYIESLFNAEEKLITFVDGPVQENKVPVSPQEASLLVKDYTRHLGADEVGIAPLNPMLVYSFVGRGPEPWGSEIKNGHPFAIAFSVEMDYDRVEEAPDIGISEETALQYLNVQKISIALAQYIRDLGYKARAHVAGSNYQVLLPPVAMDAGLGEIGRLGYLISPRLGARLRLGAVTTTIPLVPDDPIAFGAMDFCEKCKKCAVNCPSGAIPTGARENIRGVDKWQLDIEKCFRYWRIIGTDCGLCMRVCPFSHPDSFIHNILRTGIKQSSFARSITVYGDDVFYGKKVDFPRYRE